MSRHVGVSILVVLIVAVVLLSPHGVVAQATATPTPTLTQTPTPTPSYIVVKAIDGNRSLLLERTVTYGDIYITGALLFLGLLYIFFHLLEIALRWSR